MNAAPLRRREGTCLLELLQRSLQQGFAALDFALPLRDEALVLTDKAAAERPRFQRLCLLDFYFSQYAWSQGPRWCSLVARCASSTRYSPQNRAHAALCSRGPSYQIRLSGHGVVVRGGARLRRRRRLVTQVRRKRRVGGVFACGALLANTMRARQPFDDGARIIPVLKASIPQCALTNP